MKIPSLIREQKSSTALTQARAGPPLSPSTACIVAATLVAIVFAVYSAKSMCPRNMCSCAPASMIWGRTPRARRNSVDRDCNVGREVVPTPKELAAAAPAPSQNDDWFFEPARAFRRRHSPRGPYLRPLRTLRSQEILFICASDRSNGHRPSNRSPALRCCATAR